MLVFGRASNFVRLRAYSWHSQFTKINDFGILTILLFELSAHSVRVIKFVRRVHVCACVLLQLVFVFSFPHFFCLLQRCLLHRFSSSFIFISSVFWLLIIFISRLFLTDASIRPLWNGLLFTWPNHKSYRAHPPQLFIHLRISRIMRSENIKSINNFW